MGYTDASSHASRACVAPSEHSIARGDGAVDRICRVASHVSCMFAGGGGGAAHREARMAAPIARQMHEVVAVAAHEPRRATVLALPRRGRAPVVVVLAENLHLDRDSAGATAATAAARRTTGGGASGGGGRRGRRALLLVAEHSETAQAQPELRSRAHARSRAARGAHAAPGAPLHTWGSWATSAGLPVKAPR